MSRTTNRTWQVAGVLLAIGCDIAAAQRPTATPPTSTTCSVSMGSLQIVPPSPHIFGSGAVWFGDGPVYVNLAWKGDTLPPARFNFSMIPIYSGQPWPAKTPVVAEPSYVGAIVIRGRALDAISTPLMFNSEHGPADHLELQAPHDDRPLPIGRSGPPASSFRRRDAMSCKFGRPGNWKRLCSRRRADHLQAPTLRTGNRSRSVAMSRAVLS